MLLSLTVATSVSAAPLTMRQALILGLENNFDLRVAKLNQPVADATVAGEESRFDIQSEATFSVLDQKVPISSSFSQGDLSSESRTTQGELALTKQFSFGTATRVGIQAQRSESDLFDFLADRLDPAYRAALVLDLTQPLLQGLGSGVNTANLKIAEARSGQVALGYLDSAQRLVRDIERAYLDLSLASAVYEYRQQSRDLAAELLGANQRKLDAGLVPVTEVNQANTALAGREEQLIVSHQLIEIALNTLRDLIEHDKSGVIPDQPQLDPLIIPDADPPKYDAAMAIALQSRPDLNQARLELDASRIQLVFAKNKQLPRLDLQASLNVNGLAGDGPAGTLQGDLGDAFAGAIDGDGVEWSVGLQFKYPLGNRAARAQKVAAEAGQSQALYRFRRLEVAAETEIKNALVIIGRGKERLVVSDRFVSLAETTLEQENRRMQEGLSDSFRLLSFQDAVIAARIRRATALIDYRKGLALLYKAMGQNLEYYDITAALPSQGVEQ
jgi:outer membrane protein TolC